MYVEIAYRYLNKDSKECMARNVYGDENSFMSKYEAMKDKSGNVDMYIGAYGHDVYPAKGKKLPPYKLRGDLYIDVDVDGAAVDPDAYNTARDEAMAIVGWITSHYHIPSSMMEIYYSGSKGFHVIAPTSEMGLGAHEELNKIYHYIALQIKQDVAPHVDKGIYDRKRVLRLEGSINSKTGLYKVPVTYSQLKEFDLEQMRVWASEPHDLVRVEPKMTLWSKASLISLVNSNKWQNKNTTTIKKAHQSLYLPLKEKKNSLDLGLVVDSSSNGRIDAIKRLDVNYFHDVIPNKYNGVTMAADRAKMAVKSEIDMMSLTGLGNTFRCIFHDDDNPSACILSPNADNGYSDWIYHCSSGNCDYGGVSLDNIGLVKAISGRGFMDCLCFLASIIGININHNGSGDSRTIRGMVAANYATLRQISSSNRKRAHLLNSLVPIYEAICDEAIRKADHHDYLTGGDSIIFSASKRYITKKIYGSYSKSSSTVFKKIQVLAAIGAVTKIPDAMVPESMQNGMRKSKKCGNAIQYYMLRPLDSLAVILNMERAIDTWNEARGTIRDVSYDYLSVIYGREKGAEIYVKEWSHAAAEIYEDYGWMMAA